MEEFIEAQEIVQDTSIVTSNIYQFYRSEFKISGTVLPYFFVEAPVKNIIDDFTLFEQIPGIEEFPVSTLIQRELDETRSMRMYKHYLVSDAVKFYAPLLVVLIPYKGRTLSDAYHDCKYPEESVYRALHINEKEFIFKESGGIFEVFRSGTNNNKTGAVAWDKGIVYAVVIDGQHRFKSLCNYYQNRHEDSLTIKVPMLVMDLRNTKYSSTIPKIVRRIFIDLNQKAEKIDKGRLILLDDLSVPAICVQELLEKRDNEEYLRLENVDIRCDNGKHLPYFLTGVTTLYFIFNDIFLAKKSIEFKDLKQLPSKLKDWRNRLEDFLGIDSFIKEQDNVNTLTGENKILQSETIEAMVDLYIEKNSNNIAIDPEEEEPEVEDLFEIKKGHYFLMKDLFRKKWKDHIVTIYRDAPVFSDYWKVLTKYGGNSPDSDFYKFLRSNRNMQKNIKKDQQISLALNELSKISSENINYLAVGQKALFQLYYKRYVVGTEANTDKFIQDLCKLTTAIEKTAIISFWSKDSELSDGTPIWHLIATNSAGLVDNTFDSALRIFSIYSFLIFIATEHDLSKTIFDRNDQPNLQTIVRKMNTKKFTMDEEKLASAFARPYKEKDKKVDLRVKKAEVKNSDIPQYLSKLYFELYPEDN